MITVPTTQVNPSYVSRRGGRRDRVITIRKRVAKNGKIVYRVNKLGHYFWFEDRDWAWLCAYRAIVKDPRIVFIDKSR